MTAPTVPALSDIQLQLHDTQSFLARHINKVGALEGVFTDHNATKLEVGLLRQLAEINSHDLRETAQEPEEDFSCAGGRSEHDTMSSRTIVPHELRVLKRKMRIKIPSSAW
jgi:hypothetical protein